MTTNRRALLAPRGRWLAVSVLTIACLGALAFRATFILQAPREDLMTSVEDDNYYYLLPAWNFKQLGYFTFDGMGKTFGFQPLWMVLLAGLAVFCDDRVEFLRATLLLATAFHVAAGVVLYRLVASMSANRLGAALGVGTFWLLNPWLLEVMTRGKENALYAFLLFSATALGNRFARQRTSTPYAVSLTFGLVLGILFLARVNSLVFPLLFFATLLLYDRSRAKQVLFGAALCGVGFVAATLPWLAYAHQEFGSIFPTSGAAKLSYFNLSRLRELFSFLSVYRIARSLGGVYRDVFPQLGLVCLWAISLGVTLRYAAGDRRPGIAVLRSALSRALASHFGTAILLAFALLNLASTFVLLNPWFDYGIWYHVPEQCASVLLVALGMSLAVREAGLGRLVAPRFQAVAVGAAAVAVAAYTVFFAGFKHARADRYRPAYHLLQSEIYKTCEIVERIVPKGSVLAAWNSGLLGYALDDYTVINIDGLANTRDFLSIAFDHQKLVDYAREHRVSHLVDLHPIQHLDAKPCFDFVSPGACRMLYVSEQELSVGQGEMLRHSIAQIAGPEPANVALGPG